jgi:hypothetical protein
VAGDRDSGRLRDAGFRLFALVGLIREASGNHDRVRAYPWHEDPDFVFLDFGEREPATTHAVSSDGMVMEHTCEYSGHNGDSYGHKYVRLTAQQSLEVVLRLVGELERRALAVEERRLEDAARRRRTEAAMKNLNARLKGKGIT